MESPYLIWDNGTRAELTEFLENERTSTVRRGTCDPSFGSEFKFTAHKDEIIVGNIFIRIYNQQPMFQLEVFNLFIFHLLMLRFSKMASKFDKIFQLTLILLRKHKINWEFCQNFEALLENLNHNREN